MKHRVANCPACAAPVEFKLSTSLVAICEFCHTVVARGDKKIEDLGKVADLVETGSPLHRGYTGQFNKKSFEVDGRVQYQHPAGGVWNEWYLQFPGDRVGWLAEAQGRFYLTSSKEIPESVHVPDFQDVAVGETLDFGEIGSLVVAEKGIATARSAEGNIPWAFVPNAEHRFVDLQGPNNRFATLEYGPEGVQFYLGQQVTVQDLGFDLETDFAAGRNEAYPVANVSALQVNCPHCGGPLTLHAPDQTLRVSCPNCNSLLDCKQGNLEYLQTLNMEVVKLIIPLGTVGKLFDADYTVIGFVARYAIYEGKKYPWTEYLLYSQGVGFRWLVQNDGHWSFVQPIPVSDVRRGGGEAYFRDEKYRMYDCGIAYVKYVAGEFYWLINTDDQVYTEDYISPPHMLSFERTTTEAGDELNVSLGTYLEKEIIEQAFKTKELRSAWSVGPIQPRPSYKDVWLIWLGLTGILILLDVLFDGIIHLPFSQFYFYVSLGAISIVPFLSLVTNYQFEVNRWKNSDFSPYQSSE